jgi:DNA-directed RNA polymerase specialized sigma24 family protein
MPEQVASGAGEDDGAAGSSSARIDARRQVALLRAHLSDAEMDVLVLHCAHQFSVDEVAQIMGRSRRAINSLLHRARRKARERLSRDE